MINIFQRLFSIPLYLKAVFFPIHFNTYLFLSEETETHTEDALETPIRVYRVKPTSSATPAPAARVSTAVSRPVQDCETAQAIGKKLDWDFFNIFIFNSQSSNPYTCYNTSCFNSQYISDFALDELVLGDALCLCEYI